jgi:hypothetical protein
MMLGRDPLFQMLDSATADRILDGSVAAPDSPPGYERTVALLATLAQPPALPNRPGGTIGTRPDVRRRRSATRCRRTALVATAVAVIIPGIAGAAYADVLPDSIGRPISDLIHRVGLRTAPNQERSHPRPATTVTTPPLSTPRSTASGARTKPPRHPSANPAPNTELPPSSANTDRPTKALNPAGPISGSRRPIVRPRTSPRLPPRATDHTLPAPVPHT